MRGLGTDHVIGGHMRGLEKNACGLDIRHKVTQTDGHCDC